MLADADENFTIELGYVYDKYICSLWSGKLPNSNFEETEISLNLIDSLRIDCSFNNDGTYKQTTISNNEIVHTENGIYSISDNEVICTSEYNISTTFISVDGKVFCVEYIKE